MTIVKMKFYDRDGWFKLTEYYENMDLAYEEIEKRDAWTAEIKTILVRSKNESV